MIPLRFQLSYLSPMPYGEYEGTAMANVPDEYLMWLYDNKKASPKVRLYIEQNLEDLKKT